MPDVFGNRSTGNVLQAARKVDMASRIALLEPSAAPLTVLLKMLSKDSAHNPEYSWLEDDLEPRFAAVEGNQTNSDTSIEVEAGQGVRFSAQFLVRNTRTGEIFKVTSVATDTLTVTRGIGNAGTGVAMLDADELIVVGVAQAEGADILPARSTNAVKKTNYTQIFRTPFGATETWRHSDQFTEDDDWTYQANKAGIEHKKDIEYALWLGKPSEDVTTPAAPRRTTGGVLHFFTSNITDAGGATTEWEFFSALRPVYRYSSDQRVGFGSMLVVDVLNTFPRGKVQLQQGETTYGLQVFKFISPHGTLRLITHRLFEGGVLSGYLAVLDMAELKYRYLANRNGSRDTHILQDRQAPGVDARIDEYLTECGLEAKQSRKHGFLVGVTGP